MLRAPILCTSLLLALGCSSTTGTPDAPDTPATTPETGAAAGAQAVLQSNAGVEGNVRFVPSGDAVKVIVELSGLEPGPHGFHIHETGDCSAEDFSSAGGHFNPDEHQHGAPTDDEHHAGDFGNLEAADDGTVSAEMEMNVVLEPDAPGSVIGKAVIVHGGEDDLTSQPSGAAGPRVACGVISPQA